MRAAGGRALDCSAPSDARGYSESLLLVARAFMNRFAHQEVSIAWDNLRINSGTVSCPLPTWEDDSPDWQAIS